MTVGARTPTRPSCRPGLLGLLAAALLLAACGTGAGGPTPAGTGPPAGTPTIVASTNVWADVVARVAGPRASVRAIVTDPAADPHSYESTPADAAAITGADLVVFNGGGYDDWVARVLDTAPDARDRAVEAFALRGDPADDNEHVWFDPSAVKGVIAQVAERLSALAPAGADGVRARATAFAAEVDGLAGRLAAVGAGRPGASVVATEPVAHYLLRTAGVADVTPPEFVDAVEAENEPPAAALVATADLLAQRRVAALVVNPQTATPAIERVRAAAEGAGLPVVEVPETLPAGTAYVPWVEGIRTDLAGALGVPA